MSETPAKVHNQVGKISRDHLSHLKQNWDTCATKDRYMFARQILKEDSFGELGTPPPPVLRNDPRNGSNFSVSVTTEGDEFEDRRSLSEWDCRITGTVQWCKNPDGSQRVNEYTLGEELGSGTFGRVRECTRHVTNDSTDGEDSVPPRKFAMKIMSKPRLRKIADYVNRGNRMRKITALDKVRAEIDVMRHLWHRNIILLFEVLDETEDEDGDGALCMVLELMGGGPSMKRVEGGLPGAFETSKGGVWAEDEAKFLFRDLCSGLSYLHGSGIVHRDIKPDNVMLSDEGTLCIGDFGCAKAFPKPVGGVWEDNAPMMLDDTSGTYTFQAPECLTGLPYDGRKADVWACGITLYTWIFGAVPFYSDALEPLFDAIRAQEIDLSGMDTATGVISPALRDLLQRLLDKNPSTRITLDECLQHDWLQNLPPVPSPQEVEYPEEHPEENQSDGEDTI